MNDIPPCDVVCSTLVRIGEVINEGYVHLSGAYVYVSNFQDRCADIQSLYQAAVIGSDEVPSLLAQGVGFAALKGTALLRSANALSLPTKLLIAIALVVGICLICDKLLKERKETPSRPGFKINKLKQRQADVGRSVRSFRGYRKRT